MNLAQRGFTSMLHLDSGMRSTAGYGACMCETLLIARHLRLSQRVCQVANMFFEEVVDQMAVAFADRCKSLEQRGWEAPPIHPSLQAVLEPRDNHPRTAAKQTIRTPALQGGDSPQVVVVNGTPDPSPLTTKQARRRRIWPPRSPAGPSFW